MHDTLIPPTGMQLLTQTIGSNFQELIAWQFGNVLAGDDIIIRTTAGTLFITSDSFEWEVNGDWDDFAYLTVTQATDSQIQQGVSSGNIFKQLSGQRVKDVYVVSYKLSCVSKTHGKWSYETNTAIIFETEAGCVSLVRTAMHSGAMWVKFGTVYDPEDLPNFVTLFEDTLDERFTLSRSIRSLATEQEIEAKTENKI